MITHVLFYEMKITIAFLVLILGWCQFTNAQQVTSQQIDSLEQAVELEKDSIQKANILGELIMLHVPNDFDQAIKYAKRTIEIIPAGNLKSQARSYNTIGSLYSYQGKYQQALSYFDTSIQYSLSINDSSDIADAYANIGSIYSDWGNQREALKYIYKSLDINTALNDSNQITFSLNGLLNIYIDQEEYNTALEVAKKIDSYESSSTAPLDRAINAMNTGLAYKGKEKLDSAVWNMQKGLDIAQSNQLDMIVASAYRGMTAIYDEMNQRDSALYYAELALKYKDDLSSKTQLGITYYTVAKVYNTFGRVTESIPLLQKALEYAKSFDYKKNIRDCYSELAKAYAIRGDYKAAYQAQSNMIGIKDTLLNKAKQKQIEELEIQYETAKKEQQNQLLKQERNIEKLKAERSNYWLIILGIILVLVVLVSYLLLKANRAKNQQKNVQLKHQLLRNQMNPHFIFNALIAIQSFMYKNDLKDASRYLSSFAKLVRAILENSRSEYITLDKEIQWLENYMSLQLLRFEHKFEYKIVLDDNLDLYECLIPPMLTQPFIENALEHGLKSINYKGSIKVHFYQEDDFLKVVVEDNGIGMEKGTKITNNAEHQSLATSITSERLAFLNKHNKNKINIQIENIKPTGTRVSFIVPIKYV